MQPQSFLGERNQAGHGFEVIRSEVIATPRSNLLQRFVDLRAQPLLELGILRELPEGESQLMRSSTPLSGGKRLAHGLCCGLVAGKQNSPVEDQPMILGESLGFPLPDLINDLVVAQSPIRFQRSTGSDCRSIVSRPFNPNYERIEHTE